MTDTAALVRAARLRPAAHGAMIAGASAVALLAFGGRPELVGGLYLAAVTPLLARVDLEQHRLPNAIVLPGLAIAATGAAAGWLRTGQAPLVAAATAAAATLLLSALHLLGGFGMGDVKLGCVLALSLGALGVQSAGIGVLAAFVAGGLAAMALLAAGGAGERMPFGPFLLFGYWWALAAVASAPGGAG